MLKTIAAVSILTLKVLIMRAPVKEFNFYFYDFPNVYYSHPEVLLNKETDITNSYSPLKKYFMVQFNNLVQLVHK